MIYKNSVFFMNYTHSFRGTQPSFHRIRKKKNTKSVIPSSLGSRKRVTSEHSLKSFFFFFFFFTASFILIISYLHTIITFFTLLTLLTILTLTTLFTLLTYITYNTDIAYTVGDITNNTTVTSTTTTTTHHTNLRY